MSMSKPLFDRTEFADPVEAPASQESDPGSVRLRLARRDQMEIRTLSLDQLLPQQDEARMVWAVVSQLDLSQWLKQIKAVQGRAGAPATDPRILLGLWIYATLRAVDSARDLEKFTETCLPYQWLCGGVSVNHHLLSDFRSQQGDNWCKLLTQLVGSLVYEELVTLDSVAQDGMRVRANAGKASFRRRQTLEACRDAARQQVEALQELSENPDELNRRRKSAQDRAARDRQQRIEQALQQVQEVQTEREARAKTTNEQVKQARASTTDPQARNMKFANGGYHPGYNVQFSTDTGSGIIVGVGVSNAGSDAEELSPMLDQLVERYGQSPGRVLVDGGFATKEGITDAHENHQCTVYAPLKDMEKQLAKGTDPYAPKKGDTPAVKEWRARMGEAVAQAIYRLRCQTAEWVNARCRNHGLQQMPVRGQEKCRNVALLHAITHNILQAAQLRLRKSKGMG
jgi:transposase